MTQLNLFLQNVTWCGVLFAGVIVACSSEDSVGLDGSGTGGSVTSVGGLGGGGTSEGAGGTESVGGEDGLGGEGGLSNVDCQLLSPDDCGVATICTTGYAKKLDRQGGVSCIPEGTWLATTVCFNPNDPRGECSGGDALGYWQNRAGDVFSGSSDCGPPGFERVPDTFAMCE